MYLSNNISLDKTSAFNLTHDITEYYNTDYIQKKVSPAVLTKFRMNFDRFAAPFDRGLTRVFNSVYTARYCSIYCPWLHSQLGNLLITERITAKAYYIMQFIIFKIIARPYMDVLSLYIL